MSAKKRYVVRKYVIASSVAEALRLERSYKPDEVFLDEEWLKNNSSNPSSNVGFNNGK